MHALRLFERPASGGPFGFVLLSSGPRFCDVEIWCINSRFGTNQNSPTWAAQNRRNLNPVSQQTNDVVRGDDSGNALLFVDHRQRQQIVFVEHFSHVFI